MIVSSLAIQVVSIIIPHRSNVFALKFYIVAEIFSLLGIRPKWQKENHRVTGVELIPLSELGRPRIDVTIRISGFFRGKVECLNVIYHQPLNH